jgi:hypothetical protein
MNVRGSNVQSQREIVESAWANPADAVLNRMEYGQKAMPPAMDIAVASCARVCGLPLATLPAGLGHSEIRVNRSALLGSRLRVG